MMESKTSELSFSGLYIWPISGLRMGFYPRGGVLAHLPCLLEITEICQFFEISGKQLPRIYCPGS